MNAREEERIKQLLKDVLQPVETDAEPARDVWPKVLQRIDEGQVARPAIIERSRWVWFDAVLLVGLAVLGVSFPSAIPLLLYYL